MSHATKANTPDRTALCTHHPNSSSLLLPNLVYRMCRTPDSKRVVMAWLMYEADDKAFGITKGWEAPSMPLPRAYEIRETPGDEKKGRGMFAVRDIAYGEYILRERPIILAPEFIPMEEILAYGFMDKVVLQMLYWLEPADRASFLSMQNCHKSYKEGGILSGIFRTNGLKIEIPQATMCKAHTAVCRDLSFVNHSCSPNGVRSDDDRSLVLGLRASRNITAGEEITMPYTDPLLPRAHRQANLLQNYNFFCLCAACTVTGAESDKRRRFIKDTIKVFDKTWKEWFAEPKTPRAKRDKAALSGREIEHFTAIIDALDKEGLTDFRVETVQRLAWIYGTLCDRQNFLKWGTTSLELLKMREGNDSFVELWEGWLRDPTSCGIWGRFA